MRRYTRPFQTGRNFVNFLVGFIPIASWLPKYKWKNDLLNDIVGGFTVGVMHVPQGITFQLIR